MFWEEMWAMDSPLDMLFPSAKDPLAKEMMPLTGATKVTSSPEAEMIFPLALIT